jgi:hypothetical protein
VHKLDSTQSDLGGTAGFESEHGPDGSLNGPVFLFNEIVEILDLTGFNADFMLSIVAVNRHPVDAALIEGNFVGQAVVADGFLEKSPSSGPISLGRKQEINSQAGLVDCSIQVFPFAFDLHVDFVHSPASADRPFPLPKHLFQLWRVLEYLAVQG